MPGARNQQCPHCGQMFIHVNKHIRYCKATGGAPRNQQCPTCGQMFVHVNKHIRFCKGASTPATPASTPQYLSQPNYLDPVGNKKVGEHNHQRPNLGEKIVHVNKDIRSCKGASTPATPVSTVQYTSSPKDLGLVGAKTSGEHNQKCLDCGEMFVHVNKHIRSCKGASTPATRSSTGQYTSSPKRPPYCKGASIGTKPLQTCPLCLKEFKCLAKHTPHCNVVKPKQACRGCGKEFICLPKHTPFCKVLKETTNLTSTYGDEEGAYSNAFKFPDSKYDLTSEFLLNNDWFRRDASKPNGPDWRYYEEAYERPESTASETQERGNYGPEDYHGLSPILELDEKINLKDDDESTASDEVLLQLQDNIVETLNFICEQFEWKALECGSNVEDLKISRPTETDIMLVAKPKSNIIVHYKLLEYEDNYVKIEDVDHIFPEQFMSTKPHPELMKPNSFKKYIFDEIEEAIQQIKQKGYSEIKHLTVEIDELSPAIVVNLKRHKGQSFTLNIVPAIELPAWPEVADVTPKWIHPDDVAFMKATLHAIPKILMNEPTEENMWRLSFSCAEKELMKYADVPLKNRSCHSQRKPVIRILKHIREEAMKKKNVSWFTPYFIKTHMLHIFDEFPKDTDWLEEDLNENLDYAVHSLLDAIEDGELRHYFVRSVNLFEHLDEKDSQDIRDILKNVYERLNL